MMKIIRQLKNDMKTLHRSNATIIENQRQQLNVLTQLLNGGGGVVNDEELLSEPLCDVKELEQFCLEHLTERTAQKKLVSSSYTLFFRL